MCIRDRRNDILGEQKDNTAHDGADEHIKNNGGVDECTCILVISNGFAFGNEFHDAAGNSEVEQLEISHDRPRQDPDAVQFLPQGSNKEGDDEETDELREDIK